MEQSYINKDSIIDRDVLMRVALAGELKVSESRRSISKYFSPESFDNDVLSATKYQEYAFGYACHADLLVLQRALRPTSDKYGVKKFGDALRYGKFAVVAICLKLGRGNYEQDSHIIVQRVLSQWRNFERWAKTLRSNAEYFRGTRAPGMVAYYKGKTINSDLARYNFSK